MQRLIHASLASPGPLGTTPKSFRKPTAIPPPPEDWEQVRRDTESAATLAPASALSLLVLARAYARTGYPNLAQSVRQQLLGSGPHSQAIYAGLYAEHRRLGEHDRALEVCRRAVEADPEDHAAYFAMAHTMSALGYAASYIAPVLEKAIRIAPDNPVYRISAAMQLVRCSRLRSAYEHLRTAPVERLRELTCRCSVKRLLALCVWANDLERGRALGEALTATAGRDR